MFRNQLHNMTFHIMLILKQEYKEIDRYHAETQSRRGLTGSSWNISSENMKWWQSKEECKYNHQRCCLGLLNCVCYCHGEAQSRIHLFVLDGVTSGGANLDSPTSGWARGKWNENNNIKIPKEVLKVLAKLAVSKYLQVCQF